ncbi:MAG: hypothetical protein H0X59_04440, partial [Chloroflexi bacterium]|nr:hypothetical protein [Chloroflexota bacterium]
MVSPAVAANARRPPAAGPTDVVQIVEALARDAEPGLVVITGGRCFGFVEGVLAVESGQSRWGSST